VFDAGYDLARIESVVRRKNERSRHAVLNLAPSYVRSTGQPAIALQMRF